MNKNFRLWIAIIVIIISIIFIISTIDTTYNFIDGNIKNFIDSFFEDGLFVHKYAFLSNSLTISLLAYTQKFSNKFSSSQNPIFFELHSDFTFLKIGLITGFFNFSYIVYEFYGINTINNPELGLIIYSLFFGVIYTLYCSNFFKLNHYFFKITETEISFSLKESVRKINIEDIHFLSFTNKGVDINIFNKELESICYDDYHLNEKEIESLKTIVNLLNKKQGEIERNETINENKILTKDDFTANNFSINHYVPTTKYGVKSDKIQILFDLNRNGYDVDYDICCFILNSKRKLINEECFVFYNNLISPNQFVENRADKLINEYDENYFIDFNNSLPECQSILFYFVMHSEETFPLSEFKISIENQSDLSEFLEINHQLSTNNNNSILLFIIEKGNNNWIITSLFENTRETLEEIVNKHF